MKKVLKKIDETVDVARKEGSERPKSVRTERNMEQVEQMILTQKDESRTYFIPAETARKLNIDRRSVSSIIDQNLNLRSQRKRKEEKLTD